MNGSVPKVKKKVRVLYPVSQAQAVSQSSQGVAHENQADGKGSPGDDQRSYDDDLYSYGHGQCSYGDGQTGHSGDQSSHSDGQRSQTACQTSHFAAQQTSHGDGQRSHGDGQMSQADSKKSQAEVQISQVTSQQVSDQARQQIKVLLNKNVSPAIPAESAAHETSMNKNTYVCDYCDKMFKLKQSLNRHIVEYHVVKSEVLSCDSCQLFFRRKEHLISHLGLKSCLKNSSTIHECKFCKKVFGSADKLKTHIDKNCLKKYFCNICCKFFKKQKDFSSHNH